MTRRKATQAAFSALVLAVLARMNRQFDRYGAGRIHLEDLHSNLRDVLANGHARAAYLGRSRAGDTSPFDEDDRAFGGHVADGEQAWLEPFMEDVRAGRYGTEELDLEAISRRSAFYALKLRGTALEAWALTMDPETLIYWRTNDESLHCETCPYLEAHGPYKASDMPTYPAAGSTDCLTECNCDLETQDGQKAFQAVRL